MAENKKTPQATVKGIRVKTAQVGFRRGGREWTDTTEVPISELSKAQLQQIRDEPLLLVEDIDIEVAPVVDSAE